MLIASTQVNMTSMIAIALALNEKAQLLGIDDKKWDQRVQVVGNPVHHGGGHPD